MLWKLEGADRQTGAIRKTTVEADTEADAVKAGAAQNLFVSACRLVSPLPPRAPIAPAPVSPGDASQPVDRRIISEVPAPADQGEAPEYSGIVSGAKTMSAMAGVASVIAYISFFAAFILFMAALDTKNSAIAVSGATGLVANGIWLLVVAAILQLLASLSLAVRDIARNSFHERKAR